MIISARYSVEDYEKLNFDSEDDWQLAINIFRDRIEERFLNPIHEISQLRVSGFSVMALDCLLIETLQQFKKGVDQTEKYQGMNYFVEFLTETSFEEFFNVYMARMFYDQVRNGILHQAETKKTTIIKKARKYPLSALNEDCNGLIVNRKKFHEKLVFEFNKYLDDLYDFHNRQLRENFRKKMDFICRIQRENDNKNPEYFLYFAYGANMSIKKMKERKIRFKVCGPGKLLNNKFILNKKSIYGSAKANLVDSDSDSVWGVLYRINLIDRKTLDEVEVKYKRKTVEVIVAENRSIKAETYISNITTSDMRASPSYKETILTGAIENRLPKDYINELKKIPTK